MTLKPRTNYICANPDCGKCSRYTGDGKFLRPNDVFCPACGVELVEEVKDGTRYRLSWEMVNPIDHPEHYRGERPCTPADDVPAECWHWVHKETDSERDARMQLLGLEALEAEGELIRNVRLDRAAEPQWAPA